MTEAAIPSDSGEIVALPDTRYRAKHVIFAAIMLAAGFWFLYDGYIGWPKHNREVRAVMDGIKSAEARNDPKQVDELKGRLGSMHKEYTEMDLLIQKALGGALPVAGLLYGIWTLRATRGRYRMTADAVEAPGAGVVPLVDILSIDRTRWDRKGIAIVHYQSHHPQRERTFRLDDFAYERGPTDQIFDRLEALVAPPSEMPAEQGEAQ